MPTWRWGLLYVVQFALLGLVLAVLTPALAARTETDLTQTLVGAIALVVVAVGYTYLFLRASSARATWRYFTVAFISLSAVTVVVHVLPAGSG